MSKQIFSSLRITALAIVLSFGVSYVYAWVAPTVTPTGGNRPEPINVSATAQTKSGGLTVGSITAPQHCIGASCITSWPAGGGGSGTLTSLSAGTGITLSPNPITTTGTISANTSVVQSRVTGTCPTGSSINAIASGGTVTCEIDDGVFGNGNTNYIPKWISGIQIGNSAILQDASNNISIAGQKINMANSTNSSFYGDGTNTAASQIGGFHVTNPTRTAYTPAYASDFYINATGKWASTLGATPSEIRGGTYRAVQQTDGNLVVYNGATACWSSKGGGIQSASCPGYTSTGISGIVTTYTVAGNLGVHKFCSLNAVQNGWNTAIGNQSVYVIRNANGTWTLGGQTLNARADCLD